LTSEDGSKYTIGYTPQKINKRHKIVNHRIKVSLPANRDFAVIRVPPWQAYFIVGRSRYQGISKKDHRVHLSKEYLRIIAKYHQGSICNGKCKGALAKVDGKSVLT